VAEAYKGGELDAVQAKLTQQLVQAMARLKGMREQVGGGAACPPACLPAWYVACSIAMVHVMASRAAHVRTACHGQQGSPCTHCMSWRRCAAAGPCHGQLLVQGRTHWRAATHCMAAGR
jgi:hypothetical protein